LAENRRRALPAIAEELGIHINERILHWSFDSHDYHRRIARTKPFLIAKQKVIRLEFAHTFIDWSEEDWKKVIWIDEYTFNIRVFVLQATHR